MKKIMFIVFGLLGCGLGMAQTTGETLQKVRDRVTSTDRDNSMLVTPAGLNVFTQRKVLLYSTGVSDLSLAKFFATYSTDNDKLNVGFNVPLSNRYTRRLAFILNPILEADVKNNFSTIYKNGEWKNNIRGGLKLTYLVPFSTINFRNDADAVAKRNGLKIKRTLRFKEIEDRMQKAEAAQRGTVTLLGGENVTPVTKTLTAEKQAKTLKKKQEKAFEEIGTAEAEYLEQEGGYTWSQTAWISAWGFLPISKTEQFVAPDNTVAFSKVTLNTWELNLQANYMLDISKGGTFFTMAQVKRFNNNSANASLMTEVDYNRYTQFPGPAPLNYAQTESDKAYIGQFREFVTTTWSAQIVYMTPFKGILVPGLSFRYEKNTGDYHPVNLRFGLPLTIRGKEKPVNLELQYRINDIGNYAGKADHSPTKVVGVSVGLPFSLLYK